MATFQSLAPGFPGGTSDVYTTPYPVALGSKARDSSGNEYVFCQTGSATNICNEMAVHIAPDWTLTAVGVRNGRGPVGIVSDLGKLGNTSAFTSPYAANVGLWVQIYGRAFVMISINAASPSDDANGPTTLSTTNATVFKLPTSATTPPGALAYTSDLTVTSATTYVIRGITVAVDASPSADVSAVSLQSTSTNHTGSRAAVWLNYPSVFVVTNLTSTS